jgi:hypothetical protein
VKYRAQSKRSILSSSWYDNQSTINVDRAVLNDPSLNCSLGMRHLSCNKIRSIMLADLLPRRKS